MAFTYGFYNSVNYDRRYNAIQMSQIFDGIINDGVYATVGECFIVKANDQPNSVTIGTGRAWFDGTWNLNDSDLPITGESSELILDRIDAIVLDIHYDETVRENDIIWIKGSFGATPSNPILIHEPGHSQYPIAYIYRKANVSIINQEDITNAVGSSECPFVTGVLDSIDIDMLLLQWKDQWAQFVKNYEQTAVDWTSERKADFQNFYLEFVQQMKAFESVSQKEFTQWFQGIKDIFGESVAGQIILMIENIDDREFKHYYGMVNSITEINKYVSSSGEQGTLIKTSDDMGLSETHIEKIDDGRTMIVTVVQLKDDDYEYVSTTYIQSGDVTNIETSYIRQIKEVIE